MIDNDFTRNPTVRALAELIHQLRPEWNRAGVMAALVSAKSKPPQALTRAAIDVAFDRTATTPAVIASRDGAAWAVATTTGTPTPVVPKYSSSAFTARHQPGDATSGAAAARALLRASLRGEDAPAEATTEEAAA